LPPADITLERTMPFSAESERAVLGAILLNEKAFSTAAEFLVTEDERPIRIIDDLQSSLIEIAGRNSPGGFVPMKDVCDEGYSEDALHSISSRLRFSCRYRAVAKYNPCSATKHLLRVIEGGEDSSNREWVPKRVPWGNL
jgi:hypothetical protein